MSMGEAAASLAEIERRRQIVADRIVPPLWYLATYGTGHAALLAAYPVRHGFHAGIMSTIMQLLGTVVVLSPVIMLPRLTGLELPPKPAAAFPSFKRWPLLIVAAGIPVTFVLALAGFHVGAIAVAVLDGAGAAWAVRYIFRWISRDIAVGNVRG